MTEPVEITTEVGRDHVLVEVPNGANIIEVFSAVDRAVELAAGAAWTKDDERAVKNRLSVLLIEAFVRSVGNGISAARLRIPRNADSECLIELVVGP